MKLGLTFIAALLAKSATPSLAKGTRRVAAAAEEPAVAGGDQPDVAAMAMRPWVMIEPKQFGALLIEYQAKTGDGVIGYLNCVNEGKPDSECQTEAMRDIIIATKEFFLGCGLSGLAGTIGVMGMLFAGILDGYN